MVEGQDSEHNYFHHPKFEDELSKFVNKHGSGNVSSEKVISDVQILLNNHFYSPIFTLPLTQCNIAFTIGASKIYFLKIKVRDCRLSKSQMPKAYFFKHNNNLSLLCLDSHITNYKDSVLRKTAQKRLKDIQEGA